MNISHYQKSVLLCIAISFSAHFAIAQDLTMDAHRHIDPSPKNIYLMMMDTMMVKMGAVHVRSIPDFDFMALMMAHHEGAIEMAKYEIRFGKDNEMVQLAKSILIEQRSDIEAMKLLISQLPANAKKADKSFHNAMVRSMAVMMKNMPANDKLGAIDKAFPMVMIPHHQAAIEMAAALINHAASEQVSTFAKQLISSEQIEIEQMSAFIK